MSAPVVPLVSSSVTGPLGVMHLPRLWLKLLLHGAGRLPEGYRHGTGGFDEFLTTTLGIDRDALVAYVETQRPGYLETEAWVRANAATLTPEAIQTVNARVTSADLPDPMLVERLARLHLTSAPSTKALALNDLDDWATIHESIVASSHG